MATSDVGNLADELAEKLSVSDSVKDVYVFTEAELIEIINTLRACVNEIDSYTNGVA